MKSLKNVLIVLTFVLSLASCSDKQVLPAQLPVEIQTFVKQNFPEQVISYAVKDWELFGSKYELTLNDGTMIDFDSDNVWDKISCQMKPVPAALVPPMIAAYANNSFPGIQIVKIDKERYGYDVELANNLELKFNKQGALMEVDD